MDTPSRIEFYIQNHNTATVDQLSFSLDLTKAAIHYHLRQMLNSGRVMVTPIPYQNGAGRPARQFKLANSVPKSLSENLVHFFLCREVGIKNDYKKRLFLASKIAASFLDPIRLNGSPAVKLDQITRELETLGIILRWQAADQGPDIRIVEEALSPLLRNDLLAQEVLSALVDQIKRKIT